MTNFGKLNSLTALGIRDHIPDFCLFFIMQVFFNVRYLCNPIKQYQFGCLSEDIWLFSVQCQLYNQLFISSEKQVKDGKESKSQIQITALKINPKAKTGGNL